MENKNTKLQKKIVFAVILNDSLPWKVGGA